ncbi:MAG: hypothetical protein WCQ21_27150 [Verrucomicrobiota bacterium]
MHGNVWEWSLTAARQRSGRTGCDERIWKREARVAVAIFWWSADIPVQCR